MKDEERLRYLDGPFFVTCCENDCTSSIYGPIFDYEDALAECHLGENEEYGCSRAHFMTANVPQPGIEIRLPAMYSRPTNFPKVDLWMDWMMKNRAMTKDTAMAVKNSIF